MLMDKWLASRKVSQQLFSTFAPTSPHLHIPPNAPNKGKASTRVVVIQPFGLEWHL